MNIYKKYQPIYRNATVLLRPRTPLKDMYLALDPGTKNAGAIPDGGMLGAATTNPDVDFSEILSSLDTDTRDYLLLLLAGGAQAFKDPGNPRAARRARCRGRRPAGRVQAVRAAQPRHRHIHAAARGAHAEHPPVDQRAAQGDRGARGASRDRSPR